MIRNEKKNFPKSKDEIGIGVLSDGYPVVLKNYYSKSEFKKMIRRIKKTISLLEFPNKSANPKCKQYAAIEGVRVVIEEHENFVYLELVSSNNNLVCGFKGETDMKGEGFMMFLKQYDIYKHVTVVLACQETNEEIHIFGLNDKRGQVEIRNLHRDILH